MPRSGHSRPLGRAAIKTKYQVTTGEYNKALDTKIAEIKSAFPGPKGD